MQLRNPAFWRVQLNMEGGPGENDMRVGNLEQQILRLLLYLYYWHQGFHAQKLSYQVIGLPCGRTGLRQALAGLQHHKRT
jgi:hypothetical protein